MIACATAPSGPTSAGDFAPRPFTETELATAFPAGSEMRFRFAVEGAPVFIERWVFVVSTSSIAVIESEKTTEDGAPIGHKERQQNTWAELAAHASFPAKDTTIEDVELDAAMGKK